MQLGRLIVMALMVTTAGMMVLVFKMATLSSIEQPKFTPQGIADLNSERQKKVVDVPTLPEYDNSRRAVTPPRAPGSSWLQYAKATLEANGALMAASHGPPSKVTLVTALWDIGRGSVQTTDSWNLGKRPFGHYLGGMKRFLAYAFPKIIFTDLATYTQLKPLIDNAVAAGAGETKVIIKSLDELESEFQLLDAVAEIRDSAEWRQRAAWLADSPQVQLPMYLPVVLSKLRLARDAARWNPFSTDSFLWLDGASPFLPLLFVCVCACVFCLAVSVCASHFT